MPEAQPETQKSEPFEEPPREEIPAISRGHVQYMESTDAEEAWYMAGQRFLILHTIGRKSGNEHKVALPYWLDGDGHWIIVGSYAGAPDHPAWYLNVSDRDANPEVKVRLQRGLIWADPQVLEGADYAETWAALTVDRPFYDNYQSRTDRQIPLVRLVELRTA
jgi:deazaflavin-dependent oxidoreductase (nitroreductase family)